MNKCWECGKEIPAERLEFLIESGIHPKKMTCIKHADNTKIKGIYSGEPGTSKLIFCDKVYNDSIHSKFINLDEEDPAVDDVDL